jgi:hypothetical protein
MIKSKIERGQKIKLLKRMGKKVFNPLFYSLTQKSKVSSFGKRFCFSFGLIL